MHRKSEDEIIEEEAIEAAKRIWGRPYNAKERPWLDLPFTHCTRCAPDDMKQPCVCNVVTGEALCCEHWIKDRINLLKETRTKVVSKLDLKDFCRI